jgi:hypothetical protein
MTASTRTFGECQVAEVDRTSARSNKPCATTEDEWSKKASTRANKAKNASQQLALLAVSQTAHTTRVPTWRPSTSYIPWADLLKRSFDFDVLKCPQCIGRDNCRDHKAKGDCERPVAFVASVGNMGVVGGCDARSSFVLEMGHSVKLGGFLGKIRLEEGMCGIEKGDAFCFSGRPAYVPLDLVLPGKSLEVV